MDALSMIKDLVEGFALACIFAVIGLCLLGIFSRLYDDNWLQFAGLWTIVLAEAMRVAWLIERWHMRGELVMSWAMIALQCGLLAYALGTACKVWKHRLRRQANEHARA